MRFSEMKQKEVINICDGKRLGCVVDLEIDTERGAIKALIVPTPFSFTAVLRGEQSGNVIPWACVLKIGNDAILVQVDDIWPVQER